MDDETLRNVFKQQMKMTGTAICPHCSTHVVFVQAGRSEVHSGRIPTETETETEPHRRTTVALIGRCPACMGISVGIITTQRQDSTADQRGILLWPFIDWPDRAPDDLEPDIKKSYDEARAIIGLSPAGAAVLARRCLQQVIRTKLGISKGRLFDEIEEAETRDEFTQPTRDILHQIREVGNWGAHPIDQANTLIEVEAEEAEFTLESVEMVFNDLYVTSARAAKLKKKIQTKRPNANV